MPPSPGTRLQACCVLCFHQPTYFRMFVEDGASSHLRTGPASSRHITTEEHWHHVKMCAADASSCLSGTRNRSRDCHLLEAT